MPGFHIQVVDAVVEGNEAWLFSKIRVLLGSAVKDSVDMLTWNEAGLLVDTKDVQRVVE